MPIFFADLQAKRRAAFDIDSVPEPDEPSALPPLPPLPLPASLERLTLLVERAAMGEPLHQPGDVLSDPAQVVHRARSRNGQDVRMKNRQQVQATPEVGERVKRVSADADRTGKEVRDRRRLVLAAAPKTLLASRLREMRLARGLSLGQVAIGTGVSPQGLHDLESGRRQHPYLPTLWLLADFFGVSLDNLVGRKVGKTRSGSLGASF